MEMNEEQVDLLVFGAHADDIELSCAGTIVMAVRSGKRVGLVDLTRGEMGTRGTPEIRDREAKASSEVLWAAFRTTLDFGDGNLQTGRDQELEIISLIRTHRPSIVIAPMFEDRHPDHARSGRVIAEAAFYAGLRKIETGQPAHRPQAVVHYLLNYPQIPTLIVDVTPAWETKMKAIRCYESQFHNPNSTEPATWIASAGFLGMIEARAKHWGSMIGCEYGEPYFTRTPPRVDDLVAAYRGREVS